MRSSRVVLGLGLAAVAPLFAYTSSQQVNGLGQPPRAKSYVTFISEPQTLAAGKRVVLELRFQVADGFHINSHTPKSDLLIPTQLDLQFPEGIKASTLEYPAGTPYSFSFEPNEKLDVYSGAFTVKLPLISPAGDHTLAGTLRYQACDHAACYPPKSLPVQIVISAH